MARRTVHAWIARNEEFGKLVHEFARRIGAAPHELRAIWESSERVLGPEARLNARRAGGSTLGSHGRAVGNHEAQAGV